MSLHSSDSRLQSVTSSAFHILQSAQIEHQGQYSIKRLRELQNYIARRFTTRRLISSLLFTPLPSIAIIVLIELVSLNPPSAGPHDNTAFWARFAAVNVIQSICYIVITQIGVPTMNLSLFQGSIVAMVGTAAAVGTTYVLSIQIGFPVPFTMTVSAMPWIVTMWLIMVAFSFRRILADPIAMLSLKEWHQVSGLVATQLFLYPLYNYAFRLASPAGQTALSILLGIVKIGYRFAVGKLTRQQADDKAEIVTFNAEIGHAMFVTFSMQNATSTVTVLVVIMIDLLHSGSVIYDVNGMIQRLEILQREIFADQTEESPGDSVIDRTVALILSGSVDLGSGAATIKRMSSYKTKKTEQNCWYRFRRPLPVAQASRILVSSISQSKLLHLPKPTNAVVPLNASTQKTVAAPTTDLQLSQQAKKVEYVETTLQLLHLTEFTMLGELVEFVVPIVYTAYLFAMIHVPNRKYCSQLVNLSSETIWSMALRMLAYGCLELGSLVVLDWVLRRRLLFSPTAQLAMVVETHWASVQSGFIIWIVYTVQGLLEHYGTDFSFKFAWLDTNSTSSCSSNSTNTL